MFSSQNPNSSLAASESSAWSAGESIGEPIALIAGGGALPFQIIEACARQKISLFVFYLDGQADPALLKKLSPLNSLKVTLGKAGKVFQKCEELGLKKVVFAGSVKRPSFAEIIPDLVTLKFLSKIGFKALGDDALLVKIKREFEARGLTVIGAHEICPDLLCPAGLLTGGELSEQLMADIAYGRKIAEALGKLDIGQSVIIKDGLVLGVEAIEGTDELIKRCAGLKLAKKGGVLVKVFKPGQTDKIDLPTIGLKTLKLLADHHFAGLATSAHKSLFLDQKSAIDFAKEKGLFIFGMDD